MTLRRILPGQSTLPLHLASSALLILSLLCFALSAALSPRAAAQAAPSRDAQSQGALERWISAKFLAVPIAAPAGPYLVPHLDRGGRRVLRGSIEGHALLIAGQTYARGLAMRSTGEVQVVLPQGARAFEATVGVDSNDLLFYSNQGRGSVVATVSAEGQELFRSQVLHEGCRV